MKLLLFVSCLSVSLALKSFKVNDDLFQQFTSHGISGSGSELRMVSKMTLPNGVVKKRYEQYHDGVRVANTAVTVTSENHGVSDVYGEMYDVQKEQGIIQPVIISSDKALAVALKWYKQQNGLTAVQAENREVELIVDPKQGEVYQVNFFMDKPKPARPFIIINAGSGAVVDSWEGLEGADGSGPGGNTKTGKYQFGPGTTLGPLNITKIGSTCTLENAYVKTLNLNHGTGGVYDAFAYDCGANNENTYKQINGAYSPMNDAHYFGNVLYNMYRDWVNLEPLKFRLSIRVHYSSNYENAFWNGRELTFGDGAYTFHPLVDINVVTHEAAHGFTGQNSGLVYRYESGGMNEAYSDIAGEAAEQYARGQVDWMVGADIFKQQGGALRFFKNPPDDRRSIGHFRDYYNGMDVHFSSGVYNKAFYLLSVSQGWSIKKSFQAFTTANKLYWTSQSTMAQGVCGMLKAAKDWNFPTQPVVDAFDAVGCKCPSGPNPVPTKDPTDAPTYAPTTILPTTRGPTTQPKPTPTRVPLPNPCVDSYDDCDQYKKNCKVVEAGWEDWMRQYCPDTCGLCKPKDCKNDRTDTWCNSQKHMCDAWYDYMGRYCAKTCNRCDV